LRCAFFAHIKALFLEPLLRPSFAAAVAIPKLHHHRRDGHPLIQREPGEPREEAIIIREIAMRPPPCLHEEEEIGSVLQCGEVPGVREIGIRPKR